MSECIFCKIIAGDAPATKLYEDDLVMAFLDIFPVNPGHLLVVPKKHFAQLNEVDENTGSRLIQVAMRLEQAIWKSDLPCEGTNLLQNNGIAAGQEVFHVHFHVIPRLTGDGIGFRFQQRPSSRDHLTEIAEMITKALA